MLRLVLTKAQQQYQWGSDIMTNVETAVTVTKWASFVDHVRNNRIEYLLCMGILHLVGVTNKAYAQVSGVCM